MGKAVATINVPDEANAVLRFWFGTPDDADYGEHRTIWFRGGEAFDEEIRRRFLTLHEFASAGELDYRRHGAQTCLALILVLDQFSRNLFRGSGRAFAADFRALEHARHAIAQGFDKTVPPVHRNFFYLLFEHSEEIDDQHNSVALCRVNEPYPGAVNSLDYAMRHLRVIIRFGRYPHRNEALGRPSTPAEIAFLATSEKGY